MDNKPLIIGICGGSGSGKSKLVKIIAEKFSDNVTILSHDNYYKAHRNLNYDERAALNYDSPEEYDTQYLIDDIRRLSRGETVQSPVYDFILQERSYDTVEKKPSKVILVEGILIYHDEALRNLFDVRTFIDVDSDLRLARRIKRDVIKRGRNLETVIADYINKAKPMYDKYIEPTKKYADYIFTGGGKDPAAIQTIETIINNHLSK